MNQQRIFEVIYIRTSITALWDALTNPDVTQRYWFDTRIESDWKFGSKVQYLRNGELTAKIEPETYPVDALPGVILAAVEEVAGFIKAPLPLVAGSALGALSLTIQAHCDIINPAHKYPVI